MDLLFKHVQEKLDTDIKDIRWIDWDFGQLAEPKPPVSWPCCLIDFPAVQYSNEGNNIQLGDTTITLRLGFKVYERAHNKTTHIYKDQALEHLNILKAVHKALQGFEEAHFSGLSRISFSRTKNIKHREYVITYRTTIFDETAKRTVKKVPRPDFEITTED